MEKKSSLNKNKYWDGSTGHVETLMDISVALMHSKAHWGIFLKKISGGHSQVHKTRNWV